MTGPAVPSGLEALLAQATEYRTGPDRFEMTPEGMAALHRRADVLRVADAHLAALAPDAVRLLVDMAAWVREPDDSHEGSVRRMRLLARFAALDQRAGTA